VILARWSWARKPAKAPTEWIPEDTYGGISGFINYSVTVCTQLTSDDSPGNDLMKEMIMLEYLHDVGVKEITEPEIVILDEDGIYFDDGINSDGIGCSGGGTFEAGIRITSAELEGYDNWHLSAVKFYHAAYGIHSGNIKIYEAGTSIEPGALITSEPYTVLGNGWFEIPLSNSVLLDADEDIWVSVEITHSPGVYPIGVDDGPVVDGKGDWYYYESLGWIELQDYDFDCNWNIWAKVEEINPLPPGTYPVECIVKNYGSFNESDFNVNATIYNRGNGEIFYHNDYMVTTTMYPGDEVTVMFDDVTFLYEDQGMYRVEVTSELADEESGNDQKIRIFNIFLGAEPEITDLVLTASNPLDTKPGFGWENISCTVTVTGGTQVGTVQLNITYPIMEEHLMINIPGTDTYYVNTTFTIEGCYAYHVWADDIYDNYVESSSQQFELPPNEDVDMNGQVHFMDLVKVVLMYGDLGPHDGWVREDVDNNGQVHFMDLVAIVLRYGEYWDQC